MGTLEVAAESPEAAAEALPLAGETTATVGQQLRLLRAAWGGADGAMDAAALASLAAGLPPRVQVVLDGLAPAPFPAPVARVLLNLLLLGAEALPRGGTVMLSGAPGADVLVTLDGPGAAWPPGLAAALAGPAVPPDGPRAVLTPLLAMLVRAAGLRLSLLMPGGPSAAGAPPLLLSPG